MLSLQDSDQLPLLTEQMRHQEITFTFNSKVFGDSTTINSAKFTFYTGPDFPFIRLLSCLGVKFDENDNDLFSTEKLSHSIFHLEKNIISLRTLTSSATVELSPGGLLEVQGFVRFSKQGSGQLIRCTFEIKQCYYCGGQNFDLLNRLQALNLSLSQSEMVDEQMIGQLVPHTINSGVRYRVPVFISPSITTIDSFAECIEKLFSGLPRITESKWIFLNFSQLSRLPTRYSSGYVRLTELPDANSAVAGATFRPSLFSYNTTSTTTMSTPSTVRLGMDSSRSGTNTLSLTSKHK